MCVNSLVIQLFHCTLFIPSLSSRKNNIDKAAYYVSKLFTDDYCVVTVSKIIRGKVEFLDCKYINIRCVHYCVIFT